MPGTFLLTSLHYLNHAWYFSYNIPALPESIDYLQLESPGIEHVYFVPVCTPQMLVSHYTDTADRVMWPAQVHNMVVLQVPLSI